VNCCSGAHAIAIFISALPVAASRWVEGSYSNLGDR